MNMRGLHAFAKDTQAAFAIYFSLILMTLLVTVGVGVDFASSVSTQVELQKALDSAVLAAASKGGAVDQAFAKSFFTANVPGITFASDGASDSWTSVDSISFTKDADGNVVGTAHAKTKTTLMGLVGISEVNVAVTATASTSAETKIQTTTSKIKSAQGAYDKDIYFYTRDAKGKIISETLILQYDYANPNKYYKPAKTSDITVNVGDYASYGYKMVVYEDTSYTGKHIKPKSHYSDDADASKWTKVTGKCTDSAGSTNNWEDGGDSNYLDFVFTVKCTEGAGSVTNVRLLE